MTDNEIRELLLKKTKEELTDFILNLNQDGVLSVNYITDFVIRKDITGNEYELLQKIKTGQSITATEQEILSEVTNKKIKVSSALTSTNTFMREIISFKIDYYFNECWKIYPKKVGKDISKKAFRKLVSDCKVNELNEYCKYVYKRISSYATYVKEKNTDSQYILHFSTFCNSKKYL